MADFRERLGHLEPAFRSVDKPPPKKASRLERRLAKKRFTALKAFISTVGSSGAGLPMDRLLREFAIEVDSRLLRSGPRTLPSSFNFTEAFLTFDRERMLYSVRSEHDHLFSFPDFIDFVTGDGASFDGIEAAKSLVNGHIYHFNLYDDPHSLMFSSEAGRSYGVGGVSFVRHGTELTTVLLGGQLDDDVSSKTFSSDEYETIAQRRGLVVPADLPDAAATLGTHRDLWKTVVAMRFDLETSEQLARYVMHDVGPMWTILSDDAMLVESAENPEQLASALEKLQPRLDEHALLFEICKAAMALPAYFRFKYLLVREERGPRSIKAPDPRARSKKKAPTASTVFRTVSALRIEHSDSVGTTRKFTAPQFRVDVSGYWRRLDDDAIGHDVNGNPIHGRTWVKAHAKWKDKPAKPIEVLVKQRLAPAKALVVKSSSASSP